MGKVKVYDCRSDVWALGVSLLELATLRYPFPDQDDFAFVSFITNGKPRQHRALEVFLLLCVLLQPVPYTHCRHRIQLGIVGLPATAARALPSLHRPLVLKQKMGLPLARGRDGCTPLWQRGLGVLCVMWTA